MYHHTRLCSHLTPDTHPTLPSQVHRCDLNYYVFVSLLPLTSVLLLPGQGKSPEYPLSKPTQYPALYRCDPGLSPYRTAPTLRVPSQECSQCVKWLLKAPLCVKSTVVDKEEETREHSFQDS